MYEGFKVRDAYIDNLIRMKKQEIETNCDVSATSRDLTTLLLKCRDSYTQRPSFTPSQIRAHLYTFLFAGFETTASAVEPGFPFKNIFLLFHPDNPY